MTTPSSAASSGGGGLSWQEKLQIAKSTEKIVGTSTALEKTYLRLTNAPDPATVKRKMMDPQHELDGQTES